MRTVSAKTREAATESLHHDLCAAAGLDLEAVEVSAVRARVQELRRRDPLFRGLVLVAYEYRSAMCGYDGRLGPEAVGLDAAHIRWWAFEGPDTVDSGLCLCSFHHKLLDRGVLGITDDHEVAVSAHFVGRGRAGSELETPFARGVEAASAAIQGRLIQDRPSIICA